MLVGVSWAAVVLAGDNVGGGIVVVYTECGQAASAERAAVVVGSRCCRNLSTAAGGALERVDAWLDDDRFFAPFVAYFSTLLPPRVTPARLSVGD
jgi:hypothetical protein